MQWLIDMVIAAIKAWHTAETGYFDAGDYFSNDFILTDLTVDGAYHELDISGIVGEGTKACCIRVIAAADQVQQIIRFRKGGLVRPEQKCEIRTQVADIQINVHFVLGVSEDRKIEYQVLGGTWAVTNIKIRGWWI